MIRNIKAYLFVVIIATTSCRAIKPSELPPEVQIPAAFTSATDTISNPLSLKDFFADTQLQSLIDTALANNFDLKAAVQRIEIARANTRIANAARLPFVDVVAGASVDRYGKYTLNGVGNFDTNLSPNIDKNQKIPTNPTIDYFLGFRSSWEVDIW